MSTAAAGPMAAAGAAARVMHAATLTGPRHFRMASAALPQPDAGQVRFRLEGCGVCGSDLPSWEGRPWFDYPLSTGAPGHEGWGVVDAVGEGVSDLRRGDRIVALSYHAFAGFDIAEAAHVVPVPSTLDAVPLPGEPMGCAVNVFRRSGVQAGSSVVIVGIGFLGALLTRLAVAAGARVIAVSRRPFALEVARTMGAADVVAIDDRLDDVLVERIGDRGADCVIEAVGSQRALDIATRATRERGRLVIAGYHQDGVRSVDMQLWNWRGLDVVNAHERDPAVYVRGMREAVDAVANGVLDPMALITHRFPLDRIDDAFALAAERPDGFLKAVIVP